MTGSKAGIDFDALDGQLVRLMVMIVAPAGERARSLEIIAAISRLLRKKEICTTLEMAADAASMADILNDGAKILMRTTIQNSSGLRNTLDAATNAIYMHSNNA